jgi:predicted nucleic-acid-binding protein
MKALDTNILARYLRDDDPVQSRRAAQFIQAAVRSGELLFINHVVLCELAWILTAVYDHPKEDVTTMLHTILHAGHFRLEDKPSIEAAMEDYQGSKADFADCLIGRRNVAMGCESTLSFDRSLRAIETFEGR